MHRRLTAAFAAGVLTLAAAAPAFAGPIDASAVPDQAKWMVHVDLEALRASTLGRVVLDELAHHPKAEELQKISDVVGFDLKENLLDATLYGGDFTRESVAMLVDIAGGTGNLEGLMLAAPGYESTTEDDRLIHSFIAKDKRKGDAPRMFVAIQPLPSAGAAADGADRRLVAAYDSEVLHAALDRLEDVKESSGSPAAAAPSTGSILFVLLEEIDPAQLEAAGQRSAVLRMIEGLSLDLGEQAGRIRATAHASVTDDQKAEQLRQLVQGVLAMAQLGDQADPGKAALAELARRARVEQDGSLVSLTLDADAEQVVERIRELAAGASKSE